MKFYLVKNEKRTAISKLYWLEQVIIATAHKRLTKWLRIDAHEAILLESIYCSFELSVIV